MNATRIILSACVFGWACLAYSQDKKPGSEAGERFLDVENLDPKSPAKDPVAGKEFRISIPNATKIVDSVKQETPRITNPIPAAQLDPNIPDREFKPVRPVEGIVPPDLLVFLEAFNEASSVNDSSALLPFYAQQVDVYFGKRNVDRSSILEERVEYINRFPERRYQMLAEPVLLATDGDCYELVTRLSYMVRNNQVVKQGIVTDHLKVRRSPLGYRITSIIETKSEIPGPAVGFGADRIDSFIRAYVASGQVNDPEASVAFMHSRVENYFGTRNPSRSELITDRRNYINRWPTRNYWLIGEPGITSLADGSFEVVSRIGYRVENRGRSIRGEAVSIARLRETESGLRIVSVSER